MIGISNLQFHSNAGGETSVKGLQAQQEEVDSGVTERVHAYSQFLSVPAVNDLPQAPSCLKG